MSKTNDMSMEDPAKEVLVDKVDIEYERDDKHNSSINKNKGLEVDYFIEANNNNIASAIGSDSNHQDLKSSRYSYMAGSHGLTIN